MLINILQIFFIVTYLTISTSQAATQCSSAKMPFLKNIGQAPKHVDYYVQTPNADIYFNQKAEISYSFKIKDSKKSFVIIEKLVNANPVLSPLNKQQAQITILKGKKNSHKNIPTYAELSFGKPWKGVEMKISTRPGNIEKLFTVKPQADVSLIKLSLSGQKSLNTNKKGELQITTALGDFAFTKPIAWQIINNDKKYVEVSYNIDNETYGFKLGDYDKSKELIIDPLLASTYIGGSLDDHVAGVHVNSNDEIIIAGTSSSLNFPTTPGVLDESIDGLYDLVALKFNENLCELIAATYFGGSDYDGASFALFDEDDNIYFIGDTRSTDWPQPDLPYQPYQDILDLNGTIMVAKLSADFTQSLGVTYLGGDIVDSVRDVKIAPNGNIYLVGFTNSNNYPYTAGAFETTGKGSIISVLSPDLTQLLYSTRIGGGLNYGIVVDPDGSIFVAGTKNSTEDYTITPGVYNETTEGAFDENVYIAHMTQDLSTLIAATFIARGNSQELILLDDQLLLAVKISGGVALSANAFDSDDSAGVNTTIFKMEKDLTTINEATFVDIGNSPLLMANDDGSFYVFGSVSSFDFPGGNSPTNPADPTDGDYNGGPTDYGIIHISADFTQAISASYIGGNNDESVPSALLKDNQGNIIIAGFTGSNDVETSPFAYDRSYNGNGDILIQKFSPSFSMTGIKSDLLFCNSFESPVGCSCSSL